MGAKSKLKRTSRVSIKKLLESILIKAWDNLSPPELICKFAKAILSRLKKDYAVVEEDNEAEFNKKILENDLCVIRYLKPCSPSSRTPQMTPPK